MEGMIVLESTSPQGTSITNTAATYAKSENVSSFKMGAYRGKGTKICKMRDVSANNTAYRVAGPPMRSLSAAPIAPILAPMLMVLAISSRQIRLYRSQEG